MSAGQIVARYRPAYITRILYFSLYSDMSGTGHVNRFTSIGWLLDYKYFAAVMAPEKSYFICNRILWSPA